MVSGNDQWPNHAGFGIDEMISALPIKYEPVPLENRSQRRIRDWTETWH